MNAPPEYPMTGELRLCKLVMLFWRENEGVPTGILPLAFSESPLSCIGTSSVAEEIDAARELSLEVRLLPRFRCCGDRNAAVSSLSSDSSSSPIAKAASCSSGISPRLSDPLAADVGLRRLSRDEDRARDRVAEAAFASFRC